MAFRIRLKIQESQYIFYCQHFTALPARGQSRLHRRTLQASSVILSETPTARHPSEDPLHGSCQVGSRQKMPHPGEATQFSAKFSEEQAVSPSLLQARKFPDRPHSHRVPQAGRRHQPQTGNSGGARQDALAGSAVSASDTDSRSGEIGSRNIRSFDQIIHETFGFARPCHLFHRFRNAVTNCLEGQGAAGVVGV